MKIMDRQIEHVKPGRMAEYLAVCKKYEAVNISLGAAPWRIYQMAIGGQAQDTVVIEREWESLAAMDATFTKMGADPRHIALDKEQEQNMATATQMELYFVVK